MEMSSPHDKITTMPSSANFPESLPERLTLCLSFPQRQGTPNQSDDSEGCLQNQKVCWAAGGNPCLFIIVEE